MSPVPLGQDYPPLEITVVAFPAQFSALFVRPAGLVESEWPATQITYLGEYLLQLGCQTVVVESHYVDRDYISDVAAFYSRSLRAYQNYCYRLHFFKESFDQKRWRDLVVAESQSRPANLTFLQRTYLGFCVVRPLAGSPIGRTVVPTLGSPSASGHQRQFATLRDYVVHLAGFELRVQGLAFQQQDQGVSACATTALWSAIQGIAHREGLSIPTPADITQAASRYFLPGGRALPSEGLTVHQMCEAIRASELAPLVVPSISVSSDKAQLLSYLSSGFAPVLALQPLQGGSGHAVCAVGIKLGAMEPQSDPNLHFRDASTALLGIYIHDDRLGPYASADVYSYTQTADKIRTALRITWPGQDVEAEHAVLLTMVVPVPTKLRLSVTRMRELGLAIAETAGQIYSQFNRAVTLTTRYRKGTEYRELAASFGLSGDGLYKGACGLVLSRYVGVIEITAPDGPLFDVLLDATETNANPAALACVRRHLLPKGGERALAAIASKLGAVLIV
jgi:hypothetical protein